MKRFVLALAALLLAALPAAAAEKYQAKLGDDGLHKQPWFVNSFLDLKEDLADATKAKKRLAIIWEQKGCPYCRDVHTVNLADDKIRAYVKDHFAVIQLNLWGDREVTDFDGQVMSEKELARKYRVNFTPTVQFFPETLAEIKGKKGEEAEVARMPGYFRNFHFLAMFEYVWEKRYAKGQEFQRYILEKSAAAQ
ncbi:thioredoxin family protein [Magnetospirillum sp. UT-4]|uniref:thioredoxin family protein n=1 Tax=Magnetospirillum sp. UT-4 TaxID=2681467 RepID=UPI001383EF0B|nr:thioredoxin family protein [Magnetospirillum sp. UT-4]CAA7613397.1 putative thioredoxin-like protein [Magnetospirillum sp. UT-4]